MQRWLIIEDQAGVEIFTEHIQREYTDIEWNEDPPLMRQHVRIIIFVFWC